MKKLLFLLLIAFSAISCVNYYNVTVNVDTVLYSAENDGSSVVYTVPSGTSVYIKGKNYRKYRRIKYGEYVGWAYQPNYTAPSYYSSSSRNSSSNYSSSAKTVNVKAYYRKDGTYVRAHTRSAPKRR